VTPEPARRDDGARPAWPLFIGVPIVVVIADQLAKAWLTGFLAPGQAVDVVGDLIRLVHSQNRGGLFGLLQGQAPVFAILSLGVIALIVLYHARSPRDVWLSLTLGLLLGGAIGNLIDRLRVGYVVDFVDAGIGSLRWYTFNVADAAISASLVLLIVLAIRPAGRMGADAGPPDPASPGTPG
jgi:signal peptidase II